MAKRSKVFVVSLTKGKADLEEHFQDAVWRGELKLSGLKELIRGPGVSRFQDGILVDLAVVPARETLLSINALSSNLGYFPLMNVERIAVIKQLREMGYRVAVPDYGFPSLASNLDLVRPHARVFKMKPPIIGVIGETKEMASSANWTRDLWQHIGGKRIRRFNGGEMHLEGEGGLSVSIGENATLISQALNIVASVKVLASEGHKFYFLKDGKQFMPNISRLFSEKVYMTNDHVDLFAGVAGKVMLVDEGYYTGQNKTILKQASRDNNLKMLFVPPEETLFYPANFLPLEENRVLVDKRAEKTIALLRENGVEAIPTASALEANMATGGSVRCFTNEL